MGNWLCFGGAYLASFLSLLAQQAATPGAAENPFLPVTALGSALAFATPVLLIQLVRRRRGKPPILLHHWTLVAVLVFAVLHAAQSYCAGCGGGGGGGRAW